MPSAKHEPIETGLQEHHAWQKIGATTDQEKNAVLTIIYEIFALVVSHIQKPGPTEDRSVDVDGAIQYMVASKHHRDSLRAAIVASISSPGCL